MLSTWHLDNSQNKCNEEEQLEVGEVDICASSETSESSTNYGKDSDTTFVCDNNG